MCLISYRHNFIFFNIPKTGSTSICEVLRPHIDEHYGNHSTYLQAKEYLDKKFFDSARKFAVVRNPYHWLFSMYSYARDNPSHHLHGLSFEQFLASKPMTQYDYIRNDWWGIDVDLIRLENISTTNDLPRYLGELGIDIDYIPVLNKSNNLLSEINDLLENDFSLGYNKC